MNFTSGGVAEDFVRVLSPTMWVMIFRSYCREAQPRSCYGIRQAVHDDRIHQRHLAAPSIFAAV